MRIASRFQREAEVLAAFNHPNIGAFNRLEKAPDLTALLVEVVEGEDLSQRIAPGATPVDEAFADREADGRGARSSASRLRSVKDCHPEAGALRS